MNAFLPADILLPKTNEMEKWAVIACDQFTSDQAYWDRVRKNAEGAVSTINLILPEAELGTEMEAEHTAVINKTMADYMKNDVFTTYPNSYVYVERTLENGSIREGLVHPDKVLTNANAKPGDALILTKPLGVGIITTAAKAELVEEALLQKLYRQMATLNKTARDIMLRFRVHSCTDVTGFSLMGHSYEMAMGITSRIG